MKTMEDLARIRAAFVKNVSVPVIKGLLDDLWEDKVFNDEEKESVLEEHMSRADRARCLIDMVRKKGLKPSQMMVAHLKARDAELHSTLGLTSRPQTDASSMPKEKQGWSSDLIVSTDVFKTEILNKDKDNIYPVMDPEGRIRLALLITNVQFDHIGRRNGAEKDELNMETLLTSLSYTVVKHRDLSGREMDEAVKAFSQHPSLPKTDSVFVIIMSHGKMGSILGVHWSETEADVFPIDNIYKHLSTDSCPGLNNKPKVIITQACRGEKGGFVIIKDGPGDADARTQVDNNGLRPDDHLPACIEDIESDALRRAHKEKDFISLLSCTADTVSYRSRESGSFSIQYIMDVFNTHAHKDHIDELFRKVMKRFEDEFPSATNAYQMPVKDRCTLTKCFYLFPGH